MRVSRNRDKEVKTLVRTEELQAERARKKATQSDCAKAIGCSTNTYGQKENNEAKFDIDEVTKLCDFLEITDNARKAYIFLC